MISKLRGRSYHELVFRLRQETSNIALYLRPPRAEVVPDSPLAILPAAGEIAAKLRGSAFAQQVDELARKILVHEFPLLGLTVQTGAEIEWRRDYPNGKSSELRYWKRVPYLDFEAVGDHKNVWELNRHQHLVLLAQAFLLSGERQYLDEILAQLDSWMNANPYGRGINWTSALEVAFRSLSWIWIWHMVGGEMPDDLRSRFITGLYRHGCYLECNLSVYFSANTHLLGEAVALHALGALFPEFPRAAKWKETGAAITIEQMQRQVREDGSHFEQSTYYHVYATDMFLFHQLLNPSVPPEYRERLKRMADYLNALLGPAREISCIGDDDGGRFFHPYGEKLRYGRATLATAAIMLKSDYCYDDADMQEQAWWWLGAARAPSQAGPFDGRAIFRDAGVVVWVREQTQVLFKYGPMGALSGGHSHADLMSLTVRSGDEELLIDPATYTYVGDAQWRNWFRGSAAHNTIVVDGMDQATAKGPFHWVDKPETALEMEDPLVAVCRYKGVQHKRSIEWREPGLLRIVDEIEGPAGEHEVAQYWHAGVEITMLESAGFQLGARAKLWVNPETTREYGDGGWRSRAFGTKEASPMLKVSRRGGLPMRLVAVLDLEGRYRQWQASWN